VTQEAGFNCFQNVTRFYGTRINAISFALVKKVWNSLRHFYKIDSQMAKSISCGSLVPNIAQIGQYMWEARQELMYSLNKYGYRCANLQETTNQSVHFVEICTNSVQIRTKNVTNTSKISFTPLSTVSSPLHQLSLH
jgi:hypothetical protein